MQLKFTFNLFNVETDGDMRGLSPLDGSRCNCSLLFVTSVNRGSHMLLMWPMIFPPKLLDFGKTPAHIMPNHEGLLLLLWGYGMLVKIQESGANTQHKSWRLGSSGLVQTYAIDTTEKLLNLQFMHLKKNDHKHKITKVCMQKKMGALRWKKSQTNSKGRHGWVPFWLYHRDNHLSHMVYI